MQVDSSGQVSLTQFELAPSRGSWGKTEIHDDSQFGIHVTRNFKTAKGDVKLKEHYRVGPIDEKNWRIMGSMNLDLPNGKSIQTGVGPGQDGGNTLIVRSANHDGPNAHKLLSAFIAKDSGYPVYHRIQGDDYSARVVTSEGFELKFNLVKNPMNDKLEYQLVSKTKLADNELAQHLGSVKDYPSRIGRQTPPSDNSRVNGLE